MTKKELANNLQQHFLQYGPKIWRKIVCLKKRKFFFPCEPTLKIACELLYHGTYGEPDGYVVDLISENSIRLYLREGEYYNEGGAVHYTHGDYLFSIRSFEKEGLNQLKISDSLRKSFEKHKICLSEKARIYNHIDQQWEIEDSVRWIIKIDEHETLSVYSGPKVAIKSNEEYILFKALLEEELQEVPFVCPFCNKSYDATILHENLNIPYGLCEHLIFLDGSPLQKYLDEKWAKLFNEMSERRFMVNILNLNLSGIVVKLPCRLYSSEWFRGAYIYVKNSSALKELERVLEKATQRWETILEEEKCNPS